MLRLPEQNPTGHEAGTAVELPLNHGEGCILSGKAQKGTVRAVPVFPVHHRRCEELNHDGFSTAVL